MCVAIGRWHDNGLALRRSTEMAGRLVELLVVSLATWQAVEIYRHGAIFEGTRAWFETKSASFSSPRLLGFLGDLQACPFCLSVWTAAAMLGIYQTQLSFVVSILAVSRLANLANDLFYRFTRTAARNGGIFTQVNEVDSDVVTTSEKSKEEEEKPE